MRALITGWFGIQDGEITAGDALAAQTVRGWLRDAGVPHDVAMADGFRHDGELAPEDVDPGAYTHVLFVCGPTTSDRVQRLLAPFAHCRRIAVGTSQAAGTPGLFDAVLARDGDGRARPDLSLGASGARVPVVAAVLAHEQPEYGEAGAHEAANALVVSLLGAADVAPLPVDTRLDPRDGLACATAAQLQSVLARADTVVTTRLHGLVLALRAGVPALALDPIAGGAKVSAQAAALRWPAARIVDRVQPAELRALLDWCLGKEARAQAGAAARYGQAGLEQVRTELLRLLTE